MTQADPKQFATALNPTLLPERKPLNRKLNFDDSPGLKPGACLSMLLLTKDLRGQSDSYLSNPVYRRPFYDSEEEDESTIPRLPLIGGVQQSLTPSPSKMKSGTLGNYRGAIEEERVGTQTSLDLEVQDKVIQLSPVRNCSRGAKTQISQLSRSSLLDEKNRDLEQVRENSRETLDSEETSPDMLDLWLPVSKNTRDPDLNMITPKTLVDLMNNQKNLSYLIVDCRYEYEYDGGHINGAINVVTPELLEKLFFTHRNLVYNSSVLEEMKKDLKSVIANPRNFNPFDCGSSSCTPPIIIFHCEFSQKRGPRAFRALRNIDRQFNVDRWPSLYYPQIYVLEGGYRQFHSEFPDHCSGYVEMLASPRKEDYAVARDREKRTWKKKFSIDIITSSLEGLKITEKEPKL